MKLEKCITRACYPIHVYVNLILINNYYIPITELFNPTATKYIVTTYTVYAI